MFIKFFNNRYIKYVPALIVSAGIFTISHQERPIFQVNSFEFHDKILHLIAYYVFGLTLLIATLNVEVRKRLILVTLIGIFFGISDEFHQYFIPGRDADIWDIAADSIGVIISLPFWKLIDRCIFKFKKLNV